jgi:hypothetical protein
MSEQEMIEAGYKNLGYSNGWSTAFYKEIMALYTLHGGRVACKHYRQEVVAVDGAKIFWTNSY